MWMQIILRSQEMVMFVRIQEECHVHESESHQYSQTAQLTRDSITSGIYHFHNFLLAIF